MYCELFSVSTGLINLHFSLITTKIYLEEWDLGWAEEYIMEIYQLYMWWKYIPRSQLQMKNDQVNFPVNLYPTLRNYVLLKLSVKMEHYQCQLDNYFQRLI